MDESLDILPGRKPVLEHLLHHPDQVDSVLIQQGKSGPEIRQIMDLCRNSGVRFSMVPGPALDRLCAGKHQGVAARLAAMGFVELDRLLADAARAPLPLVLALDQVQDPQNAGSLARTLFAFGGAGLLVPRHNSAHLGAAAARASAGALARLPVARTPNLARALEQAADQGFFLYAVHARPEARSVFEAELAFPAVLVLGSEDKGIRPGVAGRCPVHLAIPMPGGFDSLGVAQAGAVVLGEFLRRAALARPSRP